MARHISEALLALWERLEKGASEVQHFVSRDEWYRRRAAEMRWYPTPAEAYIANWMPRRFYCQHRIGRYIVDFYDPETGLVVEIDGASHDGHSAYDEARDAVLESAGHRVLRFTNDQALDDPEWVAEVIYDAIGES